MAFQDHGVFYSRASLRMVCAEYFGWVESHGVSGISQHMYFPVFGEREFGKGWYHGVYNDGLGGEHICNASS